MVRNTVKGQGNHGVERHNDRVFRSLKLSPKGKEDGGAMEQGTIPSRGQNNGKGLGGEE